MICSIAYIGLHRRPCKTRWL